MSTYIRKNKDVRTDFCYHFRNLEKEEQGKSKEKKNAENFGIYQLKWKAELIERVNKTRSLFFEKINKISESQAWLTREKAK